MKYCNGIVISRLEYACVLILGLFNELPQFPVPWRYLHFLSCSPDLVLIKPFHWVFDLDLKLLPIRTVCSLRWSLQTTGVKFGLGKLNVHLYQYYQIAQESCIFIYIMWYNVIATCKISLRKMIYDYDTYNGYNMPRNKRKRTRK